MEAKRIIFFIIAFIVALAMSKSALESEQEKLDEIHEKCQSNPATHADEDLLENLPHNSNNPHVQAHMLCESQAIGLQDKNGKLNKEVIKCKIRLTIDDEKKVDQLTAKCAVKKKTAGETAVHLFMCLDNCGVTFFHHFHGHHHGHGHGYGNGHGDVYGNGHHGEDDG